MTRSLPLLIGIALGLAINWWATVTYLETGETEFVACIISGLLIGFCFVLLLRLRRGRKS